jgi:hypothetical protein
MSIKRRVEILENANRGAVISKEDKMIVIPYRTEDELTRLKQAHRERLFQKYGENVTDEKIIIVGIKKYGLKPFSPIEPEMA